MRIEMTGAADVMKKLSDLGKAGDDICSRALYDGMSATADALAAAVEGLPTEPFHPLPGASNGTEPLNVLTEDDKADLLGGIGIAKFERPGDGANSVASFDGYSRHKSKRFPKGVPLVVIARSIESGSSTRKKIPFVRRAANGVKSQVQQTMENKVRECVDTYWQTGSLPPYGGGTGSENGKGIHKVTNK